MNKFPWWLRVGLFGLAGLLVALALVYAGCWYGVRQRQAAEPLFSGKKPTLFPNQIAPPSYLKSEETMIGIARRMLDSENLDIGSWKVINSERLSFIFKIPQSWTANESAFGDEIFVFYLESFLPTKPDQLSPYATYGRLIKGGDSFQKVNSLEIAQSYYDNKTGVSYTLLDKRLLKNLQVTTVFVNALNPKTATEGFKGCSILVREKEVFDFIFPFFDKPQHMNICKAISSSINQR